MTMLLYGFLSKFWNFAKNDCSVFNRNSSTLAFKFQVLPPEVVTWEGSKMVVQRWRRCVLWNSLHFIRKELLLWLFLSKQLPIRSLSFTSVIENACSLYFLWKRCISSRLKVRPIIYISHSWYRCESLSLNSYSCGTTPSDDINHMHTYTDVSLCCVAGFSCCFSISNVLH